MFVLEIRTKDILLLCLIFGCHLSGYLPKSITSNIMSYGRQGVPIYRVVARTNEKLELLQVVDI